MKKKKGLFVVIEGTDGSGKGTQTKLLLDRLKREGFPIETTDFPQYSEPSSYFVSKYLRGEYGGVNDVGPYKGSLFYAVDRFDKSFDMHRWLAEGKIIISNRYVSANMGHQTGKIRSKKGKDAFLNWLHHLEYTIFGIPKPHKTILLYMPPALSQTLVDKKAAREYIKGKKRDIHEADLKHLEDAAKAYLYVAKKYKWDTVYCTHREKLRTPEDIHKEIYLKVRKLILKK